MIQLVDRALSDSSQKQLDKLQKRINDERTFKKQTSRAKSLWNAKSGSKANRDCFTEIKSALKEMCVSVEVCNYCEKSEAGDIEHIYPKSFYPEHTFAWTNYILACKQCNSGFKLDKCFIIKADGTPFFMPRGTKPEVRSVHAFINPRLENPSDFMLLDLGSDGIAGTFKFMLRPNLTPTQRLKAEKTLSILQLNERATLIHSRKEALWSYTHKLNMLIKILDTNSLAELRKVLAGYNEAIDDTISLEDNKQKFKNSYRNSIVTHRHPSVWYAIKTIQAKVSQNWINIFARLPEALDW